MLFRSALIGALALEHGPAWLEERRAAHRARKSGRVSSSDEGAASAPPVNAGSTPVEVPRSPGEGALTGRAPAPASRPAPRRPPPAPAASGTSEADRLTDEWNRKNANGTSRASQMLDAPAPVRPSPPTEAPRDWDRGIDFGGSHKRGGRIGRASGGRAGKTNIIVSVAPQERAMPAFGGDPGAMPPLAPPPGPSAPPDRKSTRLNSSHVSESRMPSSA